MLQSICNIVTDSILSSLRKHLLAIKCMHSTVFYSNTAIQAVQWCLWMNNYKIPLWPLTLIKQNNNHRPVKTSYDWLLHLTRQCSSSQTCNYSRRLGTSRFHSTHPFSLYVWLTRICMCICMCVVAACKGVKIERW